jgi:radical SAM superfamily enzyme YgiQ (UPF0313 family)
MSPRILLVNPPVFDFAAYDFWLKPYGLLQIGGWIKSQAEVLLFDYLDRSHPENPKPAFSDDWGRGHYYSIPVSKPDVFSNVRRHFRRFGLPREVFQNYLTEHGPFDYVLVETAMTYWYPGVAEVIEDLRSFNPSAEIILGGVYATLCTDHAYTLGADLVIKGMETECLWKFLEVNPDYGLPPLWEKYDKLDYGVIKLTDGCPFSCTYCSVPQVYPEFQTRPLKRAINEVNCLADLKIHDIAFYDDALLIQAREILLPFLDAAAEISNKISWHTPNALHARHVTEFLSKQMITAGFKSFYLGFESHSFRWLQETGNKVCSQELSTAVANLVAAGADPRNITAYIVLGHPKADSQELEQSMYYVNDLGIRIMLSDFSPIPGTPDGELCRKHVNLDEPLCHNKTAFPIICLGEDRVNYLKNLASQLNQKL